MTVSSGVAGRGTANAQRRGGAVWLAAGVVALTCAASMPAQAQLARGAKARPPAVPSYVEYTTHDGDTLYEIAARYLRDPDDWAVLSRLNHVPAPRRMSAGIALRLPVDKLKQDQESARVIATSGPAEHAFGKSPYVPLTEGATLGEGDHIRTGRNGFVSLELPDGSHVTVAQDAEVDIARLRRTTLTGAGDRVLDLHHGEVESQVTHATKKDDRFQIRSPSVVAGVRGTRFKVAYDGDAHTTAVEVLDGAVGVDPATLDGHTLAAPPPGVALQASAQLVKASFGNITRTGAAIGDPVALLAAPALTQPAKVQDGKTVGFDLVPGSAAVGYRVQIARDADQLDLIRDVRVSAPHADFGDLADGTYFVRIAAIDAHGLEGLPQVYAFERRQLGLSASAGPRAGSRDYEFRWFVSRSTVETRFRFVLAASADLRHPIIDRTDLKGGQLVVSDLPAGVYYWTIVAEQFENGRFYEKSSAVRSFTLAR
ncbi:FecR domain-containing protein [Paraburkholderia sp. BL21I4N1]|uniref:FecR family protein n=1 Tax=Paraburkholderia sp. BL21I4N1 TaxID=1938801 RepID=UPI000CFBFB47|nr:FecR domain-containing protein [Paraburkholderia sp. BL21I4N1]PQV48148.1 FecR family protein [Paraburkholderia sp. BL21I4N1]